MTTELEHCIREALASRGDVITPATLIRTAPSCEYADVSRGNVTAFNAPPLELTGEVRPRKAARQHVVSWLSVAAVVALIATAALAIKGNSDPSRLADAGSPANSSGLLRTLHFAIDLPAGYRLTDVTTSADGTQTVQISVNRNQQIELLVEPPDSGALHIAADAKPITVAGHPGFVGSTWTEPTSKSLSNSIAWKYNGTAYAVFLNPGMNRATLLALARRIDFSKQTPVRVATSISTVPAGTQLAVINSTYRDVASDAAYPWDSTVVLGLDSSSRDAIRVELCQCPSSASARRKAEKQRINGKTAYLYTNGNGGGDLEIDEGKRVTLHVTSSHDDGGRWTGTISALIELARSISVTPHPGQPGKWFDAATALP